MREERKEGRRASGPSIRDERSIVSSSTVIFHPACSREIMAEKQVRIRARGSLVGQGLRVTRSLGRSVTEKLTGPSKRPSRQLATHNVYHVPGRYLRFPPRFPHCFALRHAAPSQSPFLPIRDRSVGSHVIGNGDGAFGIESNRIERGP